MIKSMTGYGKSEADLEAGKLTIEIRTLNGKNTEVNLKTPLIPKDKELAVRQKIAATLQRGTIDVFLTFVPNAAETARTVNAPLVQEYFRQIADIRKSLPGFASSSSQMDNDLLVAILRFPDVVDTTRKDIVTDENWPLVDSAIDSALAMVNDYRSREGAALYKDVVSRVHNIEKMEDEVESFENERRDAVRTRILKSLEELHQKIDPVRFEQEMVYYLEKLDINEEKVRLRQHCKYFMDTIDNEPYPGKKLGFIIQEMGREINTTGSKANHCGIQKVVVRMKDELEKVREQSMNIL